MKNNYVIELVGKGHPDRFCDIVGETILTECLKQDKKSKVAVEVTAKGHTVFLSGEITTKAKINFKKLVNDLRKEIYKGRIEKSFKVINKISEQSWELNDIQESTEDVVAGDQGIVFGHYDPIRFDIIRRIYKVMNKMQKELGYWNDWKVLFDTNTGELSLSVCGMEFYYDSAPWVEDLKEAIVLAEIPGHNYSKIIINPGGDWNLGGPLADTGVLGRKLMIDTFGSGIPHGGGAYCLDGDTEYLTEYGWKKIKDYSKGKVAQWNNGELEFVKPINYIKNQAEKMYHVKSKNNLDMVLSENHNILYKTSKNNFLKKTFKEVLEQHNKSSTGFKGMIPIYFHNHVNRKGIELTDSEIKLQIAFNASGIVIDQVGRIVLKNEEKINRLYLLLSNCGIDFTHSIQKDGYTRFTFVPPFLETTFTKKWWNATKQQMIIIDREVVFWSGDKKNIYRTTSKESADFIQYVFHSINNSGKILFLDYKKIGFYQVTKSTQSFVGMKRKSNQQEQIKIEEFIPEDGLMYCFEVPSGVLVVRRNGEIFITGNCGKDLSKIDKSGVILASIIARTLYVNEPITVSLNYKIGDQLPKCYINDEKKNHKVISLTELIKKYKLNYLDYGKMAKNGNNVVNIIDYIFRKENKK